VKTLADRAAQEIFELHVFFGEWLRPSAKAFDLGRLEQALDPDFRLIGPDGGIRDRAAVIGWIGAARGSRGPDFAIDVSGIRPVWQSAEAILLEYVEAQYGQGRTTRRLSTALLCLAPAAPCGVVWRHLQETWLQAAG